MATGWILLGLIVSLVGMFFFPWGLAVGAGLLLGTLWHIASTLVRIEELLRAPRQAPPADPDKEGDT